MDAIESVKKEMFRRKYSSRTIQTYNYCLERFLRYHKNDSLRGISKKDVKDYLDKLVDKGVSGSTLNVNLSALKFLLKNVLNKNFLFRIKYSKTPKSLPIVLTKEEVVSLFNSLENNKHKLMLKLMYGAGLRVSELVNLRVNDLNLDNNFGFVRKGKGNKDRLFIIPRILKEELVDYAIKNRLGSDSYLFNGYKGNMSVRSVQEIIKKASRKAKINKKVHPHTLRHSYATHLIENGYDVASVQSLLGHNSMETTMVYLHIARPNMINVRSPLDSLQLNEDNRKSGYEEEYNKDISSISQE